MNRLLKSLCRAAAIPVLALLGGAAIAAPADYPRRDIRLIAAAQPGGGGDTVARIIARGLEKNLGRTVIVENKPGADGNLAADAAARAQPDGHTLLLNYTSQVINPSLLAARPLSDFTPISMISTNWTVLVVRGGHPVKSFAEFTALVRKEPGKHSMAYLQGSITHMASELLMSELQLTMQRVPYKTNGQAVTDLIGGHIDFAFSTVGPILSYLKDGKLKALAVTEPERSEMLPNIPTIAETIPGYAATGWYGLVGPKNMPPEVVARLSGALRQVLSDPEVKAQLERLGSRPSYTTPQEFSAFLNAEVPRWQKVIQKAGIKLQ